MHEEGSVCVDAGVHRGQRCQLPLELKMVVRYLMYVLRIEIKCIEPSCLSCFSLFIDNISLCSPR